MISPINPRRVTPMRSKILNAILLAYGLSITVILVILMTNQKQFGDFTTQKRESIQRLSTPPSVEIR